MKIKFLLLNLLFLLQLHAFAQNPSSIRGVVGDSASMIRLVNTSVSVLQAKDSILCKFIRTGTNGSFSITNLPQGRFILLVTYPGYADYVERFVLDSVKKEVDFGNINMFLKSMLLQDVIIKGTAAAIKIKGDTTEFNAGSFKIQPNAKVEDLLKQLPGIQVDKDGQITAQGQTVQKVLVDGEEFFGDDPTLVTKNLRADMVDKVQLYDKKSDQATFTGIDDGEKAKTINIKLKEDKKNGYFGKVDGGVGSDKFYQEQLMFNAFKAKKKLSVYGTLANTGQTGLGWQDNSKYGSSGMEFTDDGGIIIYGGGRDDLDSFDGRYNGQGIPTAKNGGLHYDVKWDQDNQSLNTNYKIGSLGVTGSQNSLTQNNLPTGIIISNSDQTFDNDMYRQKLDGTYQIKFDTTSTLKVSVDGTIKDSKTRTTFLAESRRGNDVLLNGSNRRLTNDEEGKIFNASVLWTKKLKKKGRTLSLNVNGALNQSDAKGFLNSQINYYNKQGVLDSLQNIDQYKVNNIENTTIRSNLTYTEPLSKSFALVLNYGISVNNSSADRKSFNKTQSGSYDILDRSLSNDYSLNQLSNQAGAIFNYKKNNKTIINFGTRVSAVNFQQIDEYTDDKYKRNFTNWNPEASYQYKFSQQKSFRLSYSGNTTQPSIYQIQPVRVNTDPLNITLGNPDLDPSFTNRFNFNYNSYKILSDQSVWLNGSYSFTMDPIVNNTVTDSAGKSTYQYLNLREKNSSNFYFSLYLDRKIKKADLSVGLDLSANGNTYFSFINNALNTTRSYNYSGGLRISKYKQKKYDFYTYFGPSYNTSESSLQKQINNNGAGFNGNASFNIYLPGKFQIGSDGNYQYRAATESFDEDFERFTWNASLSKTFLKQDALKLSLRGYDLLNQNKGFDRNAYGNVISQTSYTNIRRYFMFSLVWDFNKMGGGAAPQSK